MKRIIKFLRWPENILNGRVPLFVVCWRVLFMPLIYAGIALAFVGVISAYGKRKAVDFINRVL